MITVKYSEGGLPYSDFMLDNFIKGLVLDQQEGLDMFYEVSTENVIFAVKLAIVKDILDYNQIQFEWQGVKFQANRYGAIPCWPDGFADIIPNMCEQILMLATQKRKRDRSE